ncbi:MAG: stalk domain-containing protein [Tissierellia bacterium]|nr:stalk domain-containing protein [Tissierellia bacterium]
MKNKKFFSLLLAAILILGIVTPAMAKDVKILINGKKMELAKDSKPFIKNGRTMVPLRAISEYFDCEVQWVPQGEYGVGNVYITPNNQDGEYEMFYQFYIGINEYMYGGPNGDVPEAYRPKFFELDVAPMIVNSRTFVPLRVVGEIFGTVEWDQATRTVNIITGNSSPSASNQIGMSEQYDALLNSFGPNDKITFRTIDVDITPQILLDVFMQAPMNKKYTNSKFNYEVNYPEFFELQTESDAGDGRIMSQTKDMELRVWGGFVMENDYKAFMNRLAPNAKTALLGDYIVYIDRNEHDGFVEITRYITDGVNYMAIQNAAANYLLNEGPSNLIISRWDYNELFVENALNLFAEQHTAPEI